MRLTLRTLLAYLDNTLDPQDSEILRQKVEQSGFATQLVQRIRSSVADPSLSAPAPDSVHPIEEPNMMSNFLDSTLAPEQIAEIEKACLESLPHLAEAAACHQILTMVLGRPAEASDRLRERVLAMVDDKGNIVDPDSTSEPGQVSGGASPVIAGEIGPRYSGVDLSDATDETAVAATAASELPSGGADADVGSFPSAASEPMTDPRATPSQDVQPVGAGDSGVFQAATKLREQSHQFAEAGMALDDAPPLAGDRPLRQLERSDFYDGEVRSSRITPWLVSLALVGILLFAISRIFAPLLGPQKVAQSSNDQANGDAIVADSASEAPSPSDASETAVPDQPPSGSIGDGIGDAMQIDPEMLPAPDPQPVTPQPSSAAAETSDGSAQVDSSEPDSAAESADRSTAATTVEPTVDPNAPPVPPPVPAPVPPQGDVGEPASPVPQQSGAAEIVMEDSDGPPLPPAMADPRVAALPDSKDSAAVSPEPKPDGMESTTGADAADPAGVDQEIATLASETALVAQRVDETKWALIAPKSAVGPGSVVVCGPEYRAEFVIAGNESLTCTLVGPTEIRWESGQATVNVDVRFGKGIVQLAEPGNSLAMTVGQTKILAQTETGQATLAFDVQHHRPLSADPMLPQNHRTSVVLTCVAGNVSMTGHGNPADIPAGGQVTLDLDATDAGVNVVTQPPRLPSWIDPEVDTGSLESEAAGDLLELVRGDDSDSLLLSLRVALGFRRNEVAALAGKTMLALGDASAYFGVDGLFSNPKQRLYWSSHLAAVRQMMDRSVEDAAAVRTAIAGQNEAMDNADGDTLFRLLTGYSQDQLKTGGDAELVADLESASMPVRVLASEHLRDISGTTLFFKPEEGVASRREEVVKKWKVRLRKESIRYPDAE
ncbi:hypothetical protein Mal15_36160 [Stieleria maiorica]|uniref:Uncharacterized protein n=1 Tax=Stieleria maiorica TaxID=2795974 RepID=A0A5B9ME45_9BACT|nr:hypothetical protein [Stieleria maiorica]QEF99551.1 hypothetical protein Mal15_36160 [Stieleria maiorica]